MHWCLLFLSIFCVNYSWCIYNIDRHKGLPLIKAATDSAATAIGNEQGASPIVAEVSSDKLKSDNGELITNTRLGKYGEIDDQTIDAFNHFPSKKKDSKEENEGHSAMATFFEKMTMFQMIMQASLDAIVNRVTNLESNIAIKPEASNDSGGGRKFKNDNIKIYEVPLENGKDHKMNEAVETGKLHEAVETGSSPQPVSGPKDEDCVKDPQNLEEAPERFIIEDFVDGSNLKKREAFYEDKYDDDDTLRSGQFEASVNDVNLPVRHEKENEIGSNLSKKRTPSNKHKKNSFKTNLSEERMKERKIPSSNKKHVGTYEGHDEESLYDVYQSEDRFKSSFNDFSNDPSQTSNIPSYPSYEQQESSYYPEDEQVYHPPPSQTKNKFQLLNKTAFENDRSRENPRLAYQIMKLERRSKHQMAPKGSDYDCLDDDGIDCPDVAEEGEEDDDKARKLFELTRRDNFQARTNDVFEFDVELINIERAEKKLEELIRQTAMIGELKEVLEILNNFKPGCPYNVPSVKVGDRCYSLELTHLNFNEARQFCKVRGGTLAQEPLNGYVWSQISKAYPENEAKDMWVGAHDERGEGRYQFFDGDEISSSDNRWEANSPSYSGRPKCLSAYAKTGILFKDHSCDKKQHFICEYRLVSFI